MTKNVKALRRIYDTTRATSTALIGLERQLHDAGLHATAQAVNAATRKLGWEAARKVAALESRGKNGT